MTPLRISEIVWLTDDGTEAQVGLECGGDEDACCLHVRISVEDDRTGRQAWVQLVDVCGDPAGEAWLCSHESELLDRYDAHQARLRGVWA